jgi:hypothetical protein
MYTYVYILYDREGKGKSNSNKGIKSKNVNHKSIYMKHKLDLSIPAARRKKGEFS